MKKYIIYDSNIADDDLAAAKEMLTEEDGIESPTEQQVWDQASDEKGYWMDAERDNLDICMDGRVLVIANLGLWNGRRSAYKIINKRNINGVFDAPWQDSYFELYVEGADVKAKDPHHDGTNYYMFRELREGTNYNVLLNALYDGTATPSMINRYTRALGSRVRDVYGWHTAKKQAA